MFLFLDTANLSEIARGVESLPLAGVTTCPTLIVQEHPASFWGLLKEIRGIIGPDRILHAQVMGGTAEEILADARALWERAGGEGPFYVKVPVTGEGFRAMPMLRREGIAFTATTIHSVSQAMLAAEHGAAFLAPYINHIEDAGESGEEMVGQTVRFLERHGLSSQILAASFRNVRQILAVLEAGAHTVTLAPELAWKMAAHPMTEASVAKFRRAWDGAFGPQARVANLP